jgi:RHS repeat-associated protein
VDAQGNGTVVYVMQRTFMWFGGRDMTGLDNAMNRYYASTVGRFVTPEPYGGSGQAERPGSWSRCLYVERDPVGAVNRLVPQPPRQRCGPKRQQPTAR